MRNGNYWVISICAHLSWLLNFGEWWINASWLKIASNSNSFSLSGIFMNNHGSFAISVQSLNAINFNSVTSFALIFTAKEISKWLSSSYRFNSVTEFCTTFNFDESWEKIFCAVILLSALKIKRMYANLFITVFPVFYFFHCRVKELAELFIPLSLFYVWHFVVLRLFINFYVVVISLLWNLTSFNGFQNCTTGFHSMSAVFVFTLVILLKRFPKYFISPNQ